MVIEHWYVLALLLRATLNNSYEIIIFERRSNSECLFFYRIMKLKLLTILTIVLLGKISYSQDSTKTPASKEVDPVEKYVPPVKSNYEEYVLVTDKSEVRWSVSTTKGNQSGIIKLKSGRLIFQKDNLVGGMFNMDMNTVTISSMPPGIIQTQALNYLRSKDFLDIYSYNSTILEVKSAKKVNNSRYEVNGFITIKGIKKPITFNVDGEVHDGLFEGTAKDISVSRQAFNIATNTKPINAEVKESANDILDPQFTINVYIVAYKK